MVRLDCLIAFLPGEYPGSARRAHSFIAIFRGFAFAHSRLRVRARISWHFGASAGQADARRRDAGDVVISSRSGNAADACPPPRPAGLRLPRPANHCGLPVMIQLGMGAAAKCQIILARALRHTHCLISPRQRWISEPLSKCAGIYTAVQGTALDAASTLS